MEEIKKLVKTWEIEKGSFIPNAPIYGMFIQELKDAIQRQEQINKSPLLIAPPRFIAKGRLSSGQPFTYEDSSKDIECFIKYLKQAYPTFKIELITKL